VVTATYSDFPFTCTDKQQFVINVAADFGFAFFTPDFLSFFFDD